MPTQAAPTRNLEPLAASGVSNGVRSTEDAVREALFQRVERYLRESIDRLDKRALIAAVGAATPVDTIAQVLAAAPSVSGGPDPWSEALLRGATLKQEAIHLAGGLLSSGDVADLLDISVAAVKQRQRRGKLLAVPTANGEWGYPARQFSQTGNVPEGLAAVLAAFAPETSPWEILGFLVNPLPGQNEGLAFDALNDPSAVDVLVEVARTYGEHGAA